MESKQRGMTLLVALIMLVVMTLAAVMSFNLGRSNALVVGNQQAQQITTAIARQAIDEVLSRDLFTKTPDIPFGVSNAKSYGINGGPGNDIQVAIGPTVANPSLPAPCIQRSKRVEVNLNDDSITCASNAQQTSGIEGTQTSSSTCADITWEITAQASDSVTESTAVVVQGVDVRQDINIALNSLYFCK